MLSSAAGDSQGSGPVPPDSRPGLLSECRQRYLDLLNRYVRESGLTEQAALDALQRGAAEFFDAMASQRGRAGFEQAKGLTASRISLVNDRDLAISIKLGEISRLLAEATAAQLWKLSLRLATLLGRETIEPTDNPLGAEGVCAGLAEMCGAMRCDAATAASLLDGIGARLAKELPVAYTEINELLVRRNVHPVRRPRASAAGETSVRGSAADAFGALQQAMSSRAAPAGAARPAEVAAGGGVAFERQTAVLASANQLLARLDAQQAAGTTGDLFASVSAVSTAPLRSIREGSLQPLLTVPQAQAIDSLALVFDALFADPRLPDAIKIAYSRLQIPVLKAAILDPTFFSDAEHPARVLLDEIGRCVVGLPSDAAPEHPICSTINDIAASVAGNFGRDTGLFDRHSASLESLAARREHDLQQATEAYVPLAQEAERGAIAAARALEMAGPAAISALPPPLNDFICGDWRRVLASIHRSEGEESDAWRDACAVAADLAWSISPKATPDDRRQLALLIPALLRRVTAGLERIGVAVADRKPLFDACFELQTAALKGKAAESRPAGPISAAENAPPVLAEITSAELTLKTYLASHAGEPGLRDGIRVGAWLEFELPGGVPVRGRLCWISPVLHLLLFGNPDWRHALLAAPNVVDDQLKTGKAVMLAGTTLIDEAAKRALRSLS